jgi:NAD(P)-dependent dehydrogenase (short-subunit alcohol dehydrogenase family)
MTSHPALQAGKVAVITGGADGIGFAIASKFHALGLKVCIADNNHDQLTQAAEALPGCLPVACDVSTLAQVESLREKIYSDWNQVDVLVNNAGAAFGTSAWDNYQNWQSTLNVNMWGVINGIQAFVPGMLAQASPGLVINTGSKQGITNPPGDPAYNVSKAAVKALTEQLAHSFRNTDNCQLSAHLLVPGFVYSGLVRRFLDTRPPGAWTPGQTADFLLQALERGDFYIICPDNETTRDMDNRRMAWNTGDMIENRPALSRWHPDFAEQFAGYMQQPN